MPGHQVAERNAILRQLWRCQRGSNTQAPARLHRTTSTTRHPVTVLEQISFPAQCQRTFYR